MSLLSKGLVCAITFVGLVLGYGIPAAGSAANIYIAQSAVGAANGADCNDAYAVSFFNTSGNWGSGSTQIGPGTTVHLCGTFTFTAGTSGLSVHGSGASGNPVVIHFETGAILQSPYFPGSSGSPGGAMVINGFSYLTVDGGTDGVIQNTANGTNLADHQSSTGVYIKSATGITVQNLAIQDIYVNAGSSPSATDSAGQNTADILLDGGNSSNITINNNRLLNARMGFGGALGGSTVSGLTISHNTFQDHAWQISIGGLSSSTFTNFNIYGNDFSNWTNWQYPSSTYHTDGIITYVDHGAPTYSPNIYNNYFHGDLGNGSATAYVFCTYATASGSPTNCNVFNNLFVSDSGGGDTTIWLEGTSGPTAIYNNTFVGPGTSTQDVVMVLQTATNVTFENNIFDNYGNAVGCYELCSSNVTTANYNLYYNMKGTTWFSSNISGGGGPDLTYSQWQADGYDSHGVTGNPNLTSTYTLQSGSAAIGAATNLTSLGITALDSDKAGVARPSSGAWDAGAYQYAAGSPLPASNLVAVPH